jgi:hypothetical protein
MKQSQVASSKAEGYTWGVEIECFLPQDTISDLRISIGAYPCCPITRPPPEGFRSPARGILSDR